MDHQSGIGLQNDSLIDFLSFELIAPKVEPTFGAYKSLKSFENWPQDKKIGPNILWKFVVSRLF